MKKTIKNLFHTFIASSIVFSPFTSTKADTIDTIKRAFSYAELAKTTKNKDYYDQAIFDITNAITIEPDGELYYYRGNYRNSLGINGACDDWLKAIDLEYKADETIEMLVSNCWLHFSNCWLIVV